MSLSILPVPLQSWHWEEVPGLGSGVIITGWAGLTMDIQSIQARRHHASSLCLSDGCQIRLLVCGWFQSTATLTKGHNILPDYSSDAYLMPLDCAGTEIKVCIITGGTWNQERTKDQQQQQGEGGIHFCTSNSAMNALSLTTNFHFGSEGKL